MNTFDNQLFNPRYVNQEYYNEIKRQQYEFEQQREILNAVKAFRDLRDAINKIDPAHQQQAFVACLCELAKEYNW